MSSRARARSAATPGPPERYFAGFAESLGAVMCDGDCAGGVRPVVGAGRAGVVRVGVAGAVCFGGVGVVGAGGAGAAAVGVPVVTVRGGGVLCFDAVSAPIPKPAPAPAATTSSAPSANGQRQLGPRR